ncbi:MAG: RNase adapter RapZ, partial [Candidatus Paceibacterota bacterium]
GRDEEVKKYLREKTRIHEFLDLVHKTISITVEDYMHRGFENLMINFGCTGGQHRSVYCADQTADFLEKTFGVKTIVHHIEQEKKNWVN